MYTAGPQKDAPKARQTPQQDIIVHAVAHIHIHIHNMSIYISICIHINLMRIYMYIYTYMYGTPAMYLPFLEAPGPGRPQVLFPGEERPQTQTQPDRVRVETRVFLSGFFPMAACHPEQNIREILTGPGFKIQDATQKCQGILNLARIHIFPV